MEVNHFKWNCLCYGQGVMKEPSIPGRYPQIAPIQNEIKADCLYVLNLRHRRNPRINILWIARCGPATRRASQ